VLGGASQKFCALEPVSNLATTSDAVSSTPQQSIEAGSSSVSAGASGAAN